MIPPDHDFPPPDKAALRRLSRICRAALAADPLVAEAAAQALCVQAVSARWPETAPPAPQTPPETLSGQLSAGSLLLSPGLTLAGYWPLPGEIDPRPLLLLAQSRGLQIALPVVIAPAQPLEFRLWQPGDPLEDGPFRTRHPLPQARPVQPDLILLPLLGFTRTGGRLGYGGGFYDRTLATLRAARQKTVAIGLGWAAQELDRLPPDPHDQSLDWMITEQAVWRCGRE